MGKTFFRYSHKKQMSTVQQKIAEVESEMDRTQKNKATNSHLGLLKCKLAKLKRELIDNATKAGGGGMDGFEVGKTGDSRIGLVGFPSVGKSTLLTKMTGTESRISEFEFTTLTCVPGVFYYKGAKMQLLDLPGIIEGAKDNKGKGRQVIAVARTCDLILIILDATRPVAHKKILENELEGFGIRLNKKQPLITVRRKEKGGVGIVRQCKMTKLDDETITAIAKEYKLLNCDFTFGSDSDADDLIDAIEGNRRYVPCLYVLNKIDDISMEELEILDRIPHYVPICGLKEWGLDDLLDTMWEYLDLIRIYTKPKGEIPNYDAPVIIRRNKSTVTDLCNKLHRTLMSEFKNALVWGTSVKFNPQKVGKEHQLLDEDVVQILKKS